jgi:DnaJ-class molecular chaperone
MGRLYKCSYCSGSGKDAYYSTRPCRACGGSGSIFVPYDNAIRCGYCNGSGRDAYYSTQPCRSCGGAGHTAPGIQI